MVQTDQRSLDLAFDQENGVSDQILWSRLRSAANAQDYGYAWLELQARMLPASRASVVILGDPDTKGYAPLAIYPQGMVIGSDLAMAAESALSEKRGVMRERPSSLRDDGARCLAFPIVLEDKVHGVVAFEIEDLSSDSGLTARRLQWGASWIELLVRRRSLVPARRLTDTMDMVAGVMDSPNLVVGLRSLAGELSGLMGCEWVAIGLVGQHETVNSVNALSHTATVSKKVQVVRAITVAMQEALDQREIVSYPTAPGSIPLVVRAHEELSEIAGQGHFLTVPVVGDHTVSAVIALKRPADTGFAPLEIEFLRLFATFAGPAIDLKRRDDRSIFKKVGEASWIGLSRLIGPGHPVLKLTSLAIIAVALILSLVTWPDRVAAPATLEGAIQRVVTAPLQGYVESAGVRAGDVVTKDQVVARLDSRDLDLERLRWVTERERWTKEYRRAFAAVDRSNVGVMKAHIDEAQARIDLVDEILKRVEIRAPLDGIVVRGDLEQMLGAPVQRGDILFEIAPLNAYRVVLDVDERDVSLIRVGQEGSLVLSGLPDVVLPMKVRLLTPVSTAEEGKNVFRVEAELTGKTDILRPGMEGWGKIDIGERSLIRILTERSKQWVAKTVWRWLP